MIWNTETDCSLKTRVIRDFPDGPVVKSTLQYRGHKFYPWWRTILGPHVLWSLAKPMCHNKEIPCDATKILNTAARLAEVAKNRVNKSMKKKKRQGWSGQAVLTR